MRLSTLIISAGLVVRILLVFLVLYSTSYEEYLPKDAVMFFTESIQIANGARYYEFAIGWRPYVNFFGLFMQISSPSVVWMCGASVVAWLISAILLNKSLQILSVERIYRLLALLMIVLVPSNVAMTYVPLREALQLLGLTTILYSLIKINISRLPVYWVSLVGGVGLTGILHLGLFASVMAGISLSLYYRSAIKGVIFPVGKIAVMAAMFLIAIFVLSNILEGRGQLTETGLMGTVESYQQGSTAGYARATYKTDVHIGSGFQIVEFAVVGFLQYMLEPFPWKIGNISDLVLFGENMLRLVLIFLALRAFFQKSDVHRATAIYALLFYLIIEFVWSLGTVNWGTAARHHVVAFPFLLVAACANFPSRNQSDRAERALPVRRFVSGVETRFMRVR